MNSLEILQIIANLPCRSMGVFPSDKIPKRWTRPYAMVFNTDGSKKPGSHWVAIYVDDQFRGWYFDSYGIKPYIPEHINRIRKNCKSLRWNVKHLQSYESTVCGRFCVMFSKFLAWLWSISALFHVKLARKWWYCQEFCFFATKKDSSINIHRQRFCKSACSNLQCQNVFFMKSPPRLETNI